MKAQIVIHNARKAVVFDFETEEELIAGMAKLAYSPDGERCGGQHLREELRGIRCFEDLYGPMWGGFYGDTDIPVIRYESHGSYEILSA